MDYVLDEKLMSTAPVRSHFSTKPVDSLLPSSSSTLPASKSLL